ncbi:hypothetical protein SLEP1_g32373 [Rubroshorea leprosula]|uniref:Uncharacterized protein n=1 Tax=Rubroshorea leprosula TaxID=152421 RepID=A0AAV5KD60_9ROSI|nr:hypothetical protein SLEP1_g32373 [Rubroshorea leprosula]
MRTPSEALRTHLRESVENGSAILFAQITLFTAALLMWKTRSHAEHDSTRIKTVLSYQIISAVLVSNSRRLSRRGFIHRPCGFKVNSIANLFCLLLAIVSEKLYEKSLSNLCFTLSITVLFLILLVIVQPSTDLGFFGFLTGVIGSVAYNLFGHKFQTWIVVAICFPLLAFRCWLDKHWLEVEEYQSLLPAIGRRRRRSRRRRKSKSEIIEALTVMGFHLFWAYNLFRTNCRKIKGPPESICCTSSSIMGMPACVLIFILWFGLTLVPRVQSLFQTGTAESKKEEP